MISSTIGLRDGIAHSTLDGSSRAFGSMGDPMARLLAGPAMSAGQEAMGAHLVRLGSVPAIRRGRELIREIADSGLGGRGGAGFPTARKLATAASSPGTAVVVVNASESEPASCKDRTLVRLRPHLVLDGAVLVAEALGTDEVIVQLHRSDRASREALSLALAERKAAALDRVSIKISVGPDRFVAGESSAVVAFLEGGPAKPRQGRRAAVSGVHGRPTVVQNAETMAHIAQIARWGADWFRQCGTANAPGSVLVTVHGDVACPGRVLEVWGTTTIGEIVAGAVADSDNILYSDIGSGAVMVGGYGGTWVSLDRAWTLPVWRDELSRRGVTFGCGILGVIGPHSCGLAETSRILDYLSSESAGQCGPCVLGLPELAGLVAELASGKLSRMGWRRIPELIDSIAGRGGCAHPDGAISLLKSALKVFSEDVRRHLRHRPCAGVRREGSFPIPNRQDVWR